MEPSPSTAAPMDRFVRLLIDAELISQAEAPQIARGCDPREITRQLVARQKVTRYQASMLLQGKTVVLGTYVLLEPLGAGGMGQVFKAKHRGLKRIVALKLLSPSVVRNELALKRFQREIHVAMKLNHPNIVAAHDAREANGIHFLVMEYVAGSDLSRWVKQHGPMPQSQAVDCIVQAAHGLAHAHAAGIIHRDIKPSNLILQPGCSQPPPAGVVKILDMGLARIQATDGNAGNEICAANELTRTGSIMGTSDYIAPEQAMNAKRADHRADIYSLGCTLYFLLTGKPPFEGETAMEKVLAHLEKPIPSLPVASRSLQAVFARMVAKRPEDRYASMTEVIAALQVGEQQPRRRRLLPLLACIGSTVTAAVVLAALTLGGDPKPAGDAGPAPVQPPVEIQTKQATAEPKNPGGGFAPPGGVSEHGSWKGGYEGSYGSRYGSLPKGRPGGPEGERIIKEILKPMEAKSALPKP